MGSGVPDPRVPIEASPGVNARYLSPRQILCVCYLYSDGLVPICVCDLYRDMPFSVCVCYLY
eukprot:643251-Rhodomonas_salina.1